MVQLLPSRRVQGDLPLPRHVHLASGHPVAAQTAPRINWEDLYRRFLTGRPGNRPQRTGSSCSTRPAVPVTRYRWRASNIPTPWASTAGPPEPRSHGNPWSAGCDESRTSGAEGGPGKRAGSNAGTAPRSDPYTKLHGPARGVYYDLYVMLDIYSRYVVGWMVAPRESADLAEEFIADADRPRRCGTQSDPRRPGHLDDLQTRVPAAGRPGYRPQPLPADGCPTTTRTPNRSSRPSSTARRSPAGSAPSKTPAPSARSFSPTTTTTTVTRGIGLHTPASVHFGTAEQVRAQRAHVLDAAYAANPNRFRRKPTPPRIPGAAWINQPPAVIQTM